MKRIRDYKAFLKSMRKSLMKMLPFLSVYSSISLSGPYTTAYITPWYKGKNQYMRIL